MLRPCLSLPTLFEPWASGRNAAVPCVRGSRMGSTLRWIGQVARCRKARFRRLLHRENVWAFENAGQLRFIFGSERLRHPSPDGQGRQPTNTVMERGEKWRAIQNKTTNSYIIEITAEFPILARAGSTNRPHAPPAACRTSSRFSETSYRPATNCCAFAAATMPPALITSS